MFIVRTILHMSRQSMIMYDMLHKSCASRRNMSNFLKFKMLSQKITTAILSNFVFKRGAVFYSVAELPYDDVSSALNCFKRSKYFE
jgi:hypothetical protein